MIRYKRTTGSPITVTRSAPDPHLEAAKHWRRVDSPDPQPTDPPAPPAEPQED